MFIIFLKKIDKYILYFKLVNESKIDNRLFFFFKKMKIRGKSGLLEEIIVANNHGK